MARFSTAGQRIAIQQVKPRDAVCDQHGVVQFQRVIEVEEPAARRRTVVIAAHEPVHPAHAPLPTGTAAIAALARLLRRFGIANAGADGGEPFGIDLAILDRQPLQHLRRNLDRLSIGSDRRLFASSLGGQGAVEKVHQFTRLPLAEHRAHLLELLCIGRTACTGRPTLAGA